MHRSLTQGGEMATCRAGQRERAPHSLSLSPSPSVCLEAWQLYNSDPRTRLRKAQGAELKLGDSCRNWTLLGLNIDTPPRIPTAALRLASPLPYTCTFTPCAAVRPWKYLRSKVTRSVFISAELSDKNTNVPEGRLSFAV